MLAGYKISIELIETLIVKFYNADGSWY